MPPSPWRDAPDRTGPLYVPVGLPLLIIAASITFAVLAVEAFSYAYERIGISPGWMIAVLAACLIGSHVDIPVARLRPGGRGARADRWYEDAFGRRFDTPQRPVTIAVNVGGALVPGAVAIYLIARNHLGTTALVTVPIVAVLVFLVARPIPGRGIVTPALLPPLAAAVTATAFGGPHLAALAYVCGTLGTVIGADLLNLPRVRSLGATLVSIGGAGTFDGVFLAGILAVLLAAL